MSRAIGVLSYRVWRYHERHGPMHQRAFVYVPLLVEDQDIVQARLVALMTQSMGNTVIAVLILILIFVNHTTFSLMFDW